MIVREARFRSYERIFTPDFHTMTKFYVMNRTVHQTINQTINYMFISINQSNDVMKNDEMIEWMR